MKITIWAVLLLPALIGRSLWAQSSDAEKKPNYAVVNLKAGSGVTDGECELISDRVRSELFKTHMVNVMERAQMQEILKEQGFQQSGVCTDDACLVEMGQMLGVQTLVIGSLGKLGTIFMINVRAIDVQTAKVVKVVSVDVKGEIEDVVDHLREIAQKLVSPESNQPEPQKTVSVVETLNVEPQDTTVVQDAVKEENNPVEEQTMENKKEQESEKDVIIDEKGERNRNRAGVGITFDLYGRPRHKIEDEDNTILLLFNTSDYTLLTDSMLTNDPFITNLVIRFYLKAGPFLDITIGPGMLFGGESYQTEYYDSFSGYTEETVDILYIAPSINSGLSFVKRWYPLKVNAGIMVNLVFPITTYTDTRYLDITQDTDFDVVLTWGIRAGAEIMAGQHVGFSADFVYHKINYETEFNFDEMGINDKETSGFTQEITLSKLGLALGINFYF